MSKRTDYISRDEYFMGIAVLSAQRSKDPTHQVGACIVSEQKKIVGIGYNGFPRGCSDDQFPRGKEGEFEDKKYAYSCHAELNAIINSPGNLEGYTIYVTLMPCNECAKAIIQSGIKKIIYLSDTHKYRSYTIAAKRMLDAAGVSYEPVQINHKTITLSLKERPPYEHENPENQK